MRRLPSLLAIVIRTRIWARAIGSVPLAWSTLIRSRACAHVRRFSKALKVRARESEREEGGTHLRLGGLVALDIVADLVHGLLDHADRVRALGARVDAPLRHLGADLAPEVLELDGALLLADLQLALFQDLEHDVLHVGRAERLLEVARGRDGTLGHVREDVVDLDDLGEVGLRARAPTADRVLRAREEVRVSSAASDRAGRRVKSAPCSRRSVARGQGSARGRQAGQRGERGRERGAHLEALAGLFEADDADVGELDLGAGLLSCRHGGCCCCLRRGESARLGGEEERGGRGGLTA